MRRVRTPFLSNPGPSPKDQEKQATGRWLLWLATAFVFLPELLSLILQRTGPAVATTVCRSLIALFAMWLIFSGNHTVRRLMGLLALLGAVLSLIAGIVLMVGLPAELQQSLEITTTMKNAMILLLFVEAGGAAMAGSLLLFSGDIKAYLDR